MKPFSQLRPDRYLVAIALLVALGHAGLATLAMREKSTTADELAHITGGYTFNHWNDYRLQPENGVLPQRWQALPLVMLGADFPALTTEAWRKSDVWLVGHQFFYERSNPPAQLLFTARAMNSLFGAATVLLVFFWSYRLWGTAGALISAGFAALGPTMLAHSGLATSDMCMAFMLLAAPTAYWWHLHDGRKRSWLLSAILLGLSATAKFTAVLLLPICVLLALLRAVRSEPLTLHGRTFSTFAGRLGALAFSTLGQSLVAGLVIWAFFGFRYSAFNPRLPDGVLSLPWEVVLSFGGWKAALINFCRAGHLLPEGWLYGLAFVLKHAEARGAFLDGEYGIFGWVTFFPKAFLYKTPLTLLAGLTVGAGLLGLHLRRLSRARLVVHLQQVAPLFILFGVYWLFSLTSHLNIGHRHILPIYPVLYIFCGILGWAVVRTWVRSRVSGSIVAVLLAGLLAAHALVSARIYPHYLAYFSPVVGGPAEGYRHLVDSSLDWGQDLPALKKWLATHRHPDERLYLSYFGTDEPARFDLDAVLMPRLPTFDLPRPWYWCEPGLYALSATMLQQVYMSQQGLWTPARERLYQQLRLNDGVFRSNQAAVADNGNPVEGLSPADWRQAWDLYEQLRFARLCYYLRTRPPDGMAGYSILIYRLTQDEIDAALAGSASALSSAIEKTLQDQPP